MHRPKYFKSKSSVEIMNESVNGSGLITCDKNVININKDKNQATIDVRVKQGGV